MLYMIYAASATQRAGQALAPLAVPIITTETYPALAETADIESWKRKLSPDYAAKVNCTREASAGMADRAFKVIDDTQRRGGGVRRHNRHSP